MNNLLGIIFRNCLLIFIVGVGGCHASESSATKSARLCYVPFGAETYAPISKTDLPFTCQDLGSVAARGRAWQELIILIQKPTSNIQFDDRVVRLRVDFSEGEPIFVNQKGELAQGDRTYRLSAASMEELTEQMEKLLRAKYGED